MAKKAKPTAKPTPNNKAKRNKAKALSIDNIYGQLLLPMKPRKPIRPLRVPGSIRGQMLEVLRNGITLPNLVEWIAKRRGREHDSALKKNREARRMLVRLNKVYGIGIRRNKAGELESYGKPLEPRSARNGTLNRG